MIILHCVILFLLVFIDQGSTTSFSYYESSKHGPSHWSEISSTCGSSKRQSPINIVTWNSVASDGSGMHSNIKFGSYNQHVTGTIINNGHSIKVSSSNFSPTPTLTDKMTNTVYRFVQFHFHWKSEHAVNGKHYAAEGHWVHSNENGTAYAVVAVLFDAEPKISYVDQAQTEEMEHLGKQFSKLVDYDSVELIRFNMADLLPINLSNYYAYEGSLTTPPCTEAVSWFVMATPVRVRKSIMTKFVKYAGRLLSDEGKRLKNNNRPVQMNDEYAVKKIGETGGLLRRLVGR